MEELSYSFHLSNDKNKTIKAKQEALNSLSKTTSKNNNAIQNIKHLGKVNHHNLRQYDNKTELITTIKGSQDIIKDVKDLDTIKVDGEYIIQVENRLNEGVKDENTRYYGTEDLKGLNKKEQELLSDIIQLLKEKIVDDKSKEVYHSYRYLYHFLQSMETAKELKYMLAYISKSMGFIDANEYAFNEDRQFVFESIMFSAMTLYNNGSASKGKIAETHKRFVQEIEHKKEEVLGRTQELNTAKVQALRELGYTEINTNNAKEVLDKIAEIQSRKV